MSETENRRPLELRSWEIIQKAADWANEKGLTPNQISIGSIFFSAVAAFFLLLTPVAGGALWFYTLLVLLCFAGRGLFNIIDGLVAVEGGKGTPSGELFNDVPDRISDGLIFIAAGYGAGMPTLGWLAALLAVMTAYIRTLSRSLGAPSDFQGPMGKVQRMIVISIACFLTPIEAFFWKPGYAVSLALIIIAGGCVWTLWNRGKSAYIYLEQESDD